MNYRMTSSGDDSESSPEVQRILGTKLVNIKELADIQGCKLFSLRDPNTVTKTSAFCAPKQEATCIYGMSSSHLARYKSLSLDLQLDTVTTDNIIILPDEFIAELSKARSTETQHPEYTLDAIDAELAEAWRSAPEGISSKLERRGYDI